MRGTHGVMAAEDHYGKESSSILLDGAPQLFKTIFHRLLLLSVHVHLFFVSLFFFFFCYSFFRSLLSTFLYSILFPSIVTGRLASHFYFCFS